MLCPNCKKEVYENLKYCPSCGGRLTLSKSTINNGEISHIYTMAEDLDIAKGKKRPIEKKEIPLSLKPERIPSWPPETLKEPVEKVLPEETPVVIKLENKKAPEMPPLAPPLPPKSPLLPKEKPPIAPVIKPPFKKTISLPSEKVGFKQKHPYLLKIAFAIIILIFISAAIFAYFQFFKTQGITAVSLLPNDTAFLIEFDVKSLARGGNFAALSAKVSDKILATTTWPQIFTGVIEPGFNIPVSKLGKSIVFAIIRTDNQENQKTWVSLIETKDEQTASSLVNQYQEKSATDERIKLTSHNIAVSQVGNFVVISEKESGNKSIFEVKEGKKLPLSQNDEFKKVLKNIEENKIFSIYKSIFSASLKQEIGYYFLVPGRFSKLMEEKTLALPWLDSRAQTEAGKLVATREGLEITGAREMASSKIPTEKISSPDLISLIPNNATFYLEGKNLPLLINSFEQTEKIPFIEAIRAAFFKNNFNIENKANDFINKEFILFFTPHPDVKQQNLSMVFKIENVNQAREEMKKLEEKLIVVLPELVKNNVQVPYFRDNYYQGVDTRYINFPEHFRSFDYAFVDDKLIISTSRESFFFLIDTIKNPDKGFKASDTFKEASLHLGLKDFDYFFFINPLKISELGGMPLMFQSLKFENVAGFFGEISSENEKAILKSFILIK